MRFIPKTERGWFYVWVAFVILMFLVLATSCTFVYKVEDSRDVSIGTLGQDQDLSGPEFKIGERSEEDEAQDDNP